jgi:hypothetical protein
MPDTNALNDQLDKMLYKIESSVLPIPKNWPLNHSLLTEQKQERMHPFISSLKVSKERDSPETTKQRAHILASLEQLIDIFANLDYSSEKTDI